MIRVPFPRKLHIDPGKIIQHYYFFWFQLQDWVSLVYYGVRVFHSLIRHRKNCPFIFLFWLSCSFWLSSFILFITINSRWSPYLKFKLCPYFYPSPSSSRGDTAWTVSQIVACVCRDHDFGGHFLRSSGYFNPLLVRSSHCTLQATLRNPLVHSNLPSFLSFLCTSVLWPQDFLLHLGTIFTLPSAVHLLRLVLSSPL